MTQTGNKIFMLFAFQTVFIEQKKDCTAGVTVQP